MEHLENRVLLAADILVVSPNGGENWQVGTSRSVSWSVSNGSSIYGFNYYLSTNNGASYPTYLGGTAFSSTRSFSFTPTAAQVTSNAKILVQAIDSNATVIGSDASDSSFTISNSSSAPTAPSLSNDAPVWDTTAPAGPAVRLRWAASDGNPAPVYDVYRNGSLYAAGIVGTTYYNSRGLVAGQTYSYSVTARNSLGSTPSNPITVLIPISIGGLTPPATLAMAAGDLSSPGPTLPNVTPVVSWSAVAGASGYGLYIVDAVTRVIVYPNASGSTGNPLGGTSFTLPSGYLQSGNEYLWYMSSFSGSTETAYFSAPRYFQTTGPVPGPRPNLVPKTVSLSTASGEVGSSVTVNWTMTNAGDADAVATVAGLRLGTSQTAYGGISLDGAFPTPAIPKGKGAAQTTTFRNYLNCESAAQAGGTTGECRPA